MFDSPFDYCPRCGEVVLIDQTQAECAKDHGCPSGTDCPLGKAFCGIDFSVIQSKEKLLEEGY